MYNALVTYNPVGVGEIELNTLILDLNGTLAVKGELVIGCPQRIQKLKDMGYKIYLFTGDQRGDAALKAAELGIEVKIAKTTEEKEKLTTVLEVGKTVAIGNARIDIGTFKSTKVRIGVLQAEGIHIGIISSLDILIPSINDALDLLIYPEIFNATMRK